MTQAAIEYRREWIGSADCSLFHRDGFVRFILRSGTSNFLTRWDSYRTHTPFYSKSINISVREGIRKADKGGGLIVEGIVLRIPTLGAVQHNILASRISLSRERAQVRGEGEGERDPEPVVV